MAASNDNSFQSNRTSAEFYAHINLTRSDHTGVKISKDDKMLYHEVTEDSDEGRYVTQ